MAWWNLFSWGKKEEETKGKASKKGAISKSKFEVALAKAAEELSGMVAYATGRKDVTMKGFTLKLDKKDCLKFKDYAVEGDTITLVIEVISSPVRLKNTIDFWANRFLSKFLRQAQFSGTLRLALKGKEKEEWAKQIK